MNGQGYGPYAEYQDSGRHWLGKIPAHWSANALKFLSSERVKDGPHETPTFVDEGIPFFSVDGIQNNELVLEGCRFISESDHERYSQKCRPVAGDVLLGKAASVGKVAHVQLKQPYNVWSPLAVIRPQDQRMGRYIYYSIQSAYLQAQCVVQSNSNTQNNLSMRAIDDLCFPAPPIKEQTQIAKFLDYETAKIDVLIEKQQQLIALLDEKRQAVISHAVTKGLNPDAPMRDSGVEWLGEVPAHWTIGKLRYLFAASPCYGVLVPDADPHGVPMLRINDLTSGEIARDQLDRISPGLSAQYHRSIIQSGDLVLSVVGQLGVTRVVTDEFASVNLSRNVARMQLGPRMLSKFACWIFNSRQFEYYTDLKCVGTAQRLLNMSALTEFVTACPPLEEQAAIQRFIDSKAAGVDELIERARGFTTLLEERRTALISAAVTGKIDVRDWRPPTSESEAEVA